VPRSLLGLQRLLSHHFFLLKSEQGHPARSGRQQRLHRRALPLPVRVAEAVASLLRSLCGLGQTPAIEPQRMSSLYLYFDPGGGVGWRRAITGFGSTYVTSGEYQCSRLIETRIGIKRGV
jgi:hypothetical protein